VTLANQPQNALTTHTHAQSIEMMICSHQWCIMSTKYSTKITLIRDLENAIYTRCYLDTRNTLTGSRRLQRNGEYGAVYSDQPRQRSKLMQLCVKILDLRLGIQSESTPRYTSFFWLCLNGSSQTGTRLLTTVLTRSPYVLRLAFK